MAAKTGIFPVLLGETFTTSGATTWGNTTSKQVGVIRIDSAHTVTFDSTNYPGEPGDAVLCVNTSEGNRTVEITPSPFSDDGNDDITLGDGDTCVMVYHGTHGWLQLASTGNVA